jgi:hypothetical protein
MLSQITPAGSLGPHRGPHLAEVLERLWLRPVSEPLWRAPAVLAPGERKPPAGPTGRVLRGLRPNQRMQLTGRMGAGRRVGGALRWRR